ncbi:hypothetical protein DESC_720218 [Desulfosarcina cetonica]|nr:hypothetical protein DESC_720218 [Desulfosarcina cetonica]
MDLLPGDRIFGNHGDVLGIWIFADFGDLALDQNDVFVFLDLIVEFLVPVAGRTDIDVKNVYLGIRILLTDVGGVFERSHTADVRTVGQVILVTGAGALDEGHAGRCLVVGWALDLSLGGAVVGRQAFEHHVGDDVVVLAEAQIVDAVGIVRLPTGGPDDGAHGQVDGLGLHLKVHGVVFARFLDFGGVVGADHLGRNDIFCRKGHLKGQVGGLGSAHAEVVLVGDFGLAGLAAGAAAGAILIHVTGIKLDTDFVVPGPAVDAFHFRQGEHFDSGIVLDPPKVDLKSAGRRT